MHFAARTSFEWGTSAYGAALHKARRAGNLLDLTVSNPTACRLQVPVAMVDALGNPAALSYLPDPLGLPAARAAVATMYRQNYEASITPDRLLLTTSTSESYGYLLRLLCDPGDNILVPSPSYPLFQLLARLHDVELVEYPLVYHDGWQLHPALLRAAVTPRTRAIVVIHPNNPTGHYYSAADRAALLAVAAEFDLPVIVDEVFLDYPVERGRAPSFLADSTWPAGVADPDASAVLTFVLGGLSKSLCLPQMKVGWLAARGPATAVAEAMARLEVIADTFLAVGTPPQLALPAWLGQLGPVQQMVRVRIATNLAELDRQMQGSVISRLRVDAGWSVVLRVPATEDDDELAVRLLEGHRVAVHPGSLYGFAARGWLVVSLLPQPEDFQRGVAALLQAF